MIMTYGAGDESESLDVGPKETFLLVGSRVSDDMFVAARPGKPGFSGSPGSIQIYRFGPAGVHPLQTVSDAIRVAGSLVDPTEGLIHVPNEVSANTTFYPQAMRGGGGDIVTYRIGVDGHLIEVDRALAFGARPAHLSFAAQGHFVVQANRGAGRDGGGPCTTAELDTNGYLHPRIHITEHSVVCRRRNGDGTLGDVVDVFTTETFFEAGYCAVVCNPADDLQVACSSEDGRVRILRLDRGRFAQILAFDVEGKQDLQPEAVSVTFHPAGRWLYARRAWSPRIRLIDCAPEVPRIVGDFDAVQAGSMSINVPTAHAKAGFCRQSVLIDASGRTLYALLSAGHEAPTGGVAVCRVSRVSGRPTPIQILRHPAGASPGCGFALAPDGDHLAVPCPESDEVLIFEVGCDGVLSTRYRFKRDGATHAHFFRRVADLTVRGGQI